MINIQGLYHQPLSNYAFAIDENTIILRLRTKRNDLDKVFLNFGDTAYRGNPVLYTTLQMNVFASDEYFDYYEVELKDTYKRIVYYFELHKDKDIKYYYGDIVYNELSTERNDLFKLPYHRKEDIIDVPEWLKKATIYNIFPDSFVSENPLNNKPNQQLPFEDHIVKSKLGGTLNSVKENLEYIKNLGFNTVYLNPIFTAGEYHKYDTIDYYSIDPNFGTNKEFKELVDEIHKQDMRIIIDGVFNHSGWNFFAFEDVVRNQKNSSYKDWFYRLEFPVVKPDTFEQIPNYECFGYERLMPKLNTSNKELISYFMDVVTYWTKEYNIDGWRLDVADEVDTEFWRIFRRTVKAINNNVVLIGEVWQSAKYFLDGSMFDSTMNYSFLKHAKDFFAQRKLTSEQFNTRITSQLTRYHKNINYGQLNLLDSHDVPRFLSHCEEDIHSYKLALIFLFTFVGAPMLFYGDELGFVGISEDEYRQPMQYNKHHLQDFITNLTSIRTNHLSIQTGDYKTLLSCEDDGLLIYKRFNKTEEIIVILNVSSNYNDVSKITKSSTVLLSNTKDVDTITPNGYMILFKEVNHVDNN